MSVLSRVAKMSAKKISKKNHQVSEAFDENNFGRAFGLSGLLHKPYFYQTLNGPDIFNRTLNGLSFNCMNF